MGGAGHWAPLWLRPCC